MDTQQQKSWKILLIGDHCLDIYHYGIAERLSPEAPVPVLKQLEVETKMGMSSNVKMNLKSFGLVVNHVHNTTPLEKHRVVDSRFNQHLIRFDVGEGSLLNEVELSRIEKVRDIDAVVISDYNKGFLRYNSISSICDMYKDIPVFVDTKKNKMTCYHNCFVKVNEKEFKDINKMPHECEFIITMGSKGALYKHDIYPTEKTEVFDVCGAGDVFLAALVYGYLEHKDIKKAIQIANKCASFSVSKMGTYVLTKEDIDDLCV